VDCRCYGKQAETFNQYMSKGRPVLVEGRLQYNAWEGKDGQKRNKLRVVVERFQFLGSPGGAARPAPPPAEAPPAGADEAPASPTTGEPPGDDVPF